jgi:hypothetical protein
MTEKMRPGSGLFAFLGGLAVILLCAAPVVALSETPRAPCGVAPYPDYPALDAPPEIHLWTASELGEGWVPPACIAWPRNSATLVVGLAGHFHDTRGPDALLARIGAISSLSSVRYWSVTDKQWEPMFVRAAALDGPDPKKNRADFSAAEMRTGRELHFLAADNRSGKDAVSRLRVTGTENDRFIIETANVTPLRWSFLSFAASGNVQTWYFLEREPGDNWRFYSLTRVLYVSSFFVRFIPNASYVNRAAAMYRHFVGIPTDRDPPAAP